MSEEVSITAKSVEELQQKMKEARVRALLDRVVNRMERHIKVPRNAACPCGSGLKYKKCCMLKRQDQR